MLFPCDAWSSNCPALSLAVHLSRLDFNIRILSAPTFYFVIIYDNLAVSDAADGTDRLAIDHGIPPQRSPALTSTDQLFLRRASLFR
jgi:hypothetical protein